jgi:hypothetical protein
MLFLISSVCSIFILLWVVLMVDEKKDKERFERYVEKYDKIELEEEVEKAKSNNNSIIEKNQEVETKQDEYIENVHPIKLLFNFNNVKEILQTLIKKRPNKEHLQLWLCLLSSSILTISHWGPLVFQYQFNQKVYSWGPEKQSYVQTVGSLISPISMVFSSILLVKVIKMSDMSIAIIGCSCFAIQGIVLGTFLTEMGNYVSILISANGALAVVGIKDHLSKMMPREFGKMFECKTLNACSLVC